MSVNLGSAVGSIELRSDGVTRGVRAAAAALREFEGQSATAGRNLDQIGRAGDAAGAAVARGAKQAESGVRELARSTQDVAGGLDRLAGAAGLAGTALAAGLGAAAKSAADLQSQVALISTIRPDINVTQVGDQIQAMSTRVAQSTQQLAELDV